MRESKFQSDLIKELKTRYEGCYVLKNDARYLQGVPDLTILFEDRWATLECKKSKSANVQPNQRRYVEDMNDHGFSSFIYPENRDEVLAKLDEYFFEPW